TRASVPTFPTRCAPCCSPTPTLATRRIPPAMTHKIRQIVPSSNVTMEREVPAILAARMAVAPERFSCHASRVRMHRVVAEELARMNADLGRCAQELADARVDVMSTACLVATMCMGPGYHRQTEAQLARAVADAA